MGYSIEYEELNARYIVHSGSDTILIIKPYEKDGSWIGVEYTEDGNKELDSIDKYEFDYEECQTVNDVINGVDAVILFKTKDLPEMLRSLAMFIETGRKKTLIKFDR